MPKITRLQSQKNKKRVNLFLDEKYAFGLPLDTVLENFLQVGQELTEEEIKKLKNLSREVTGFGYLLRFASMRPRSEKEVKLWFRKKGIEENLQKKYLANLEKFGLLNDKKFADWWVEQRTTFRPKSRRVLKLELAQKGISREIIDEVLQNEELPSEGEQILRIAEKKWKRLQNLEPKLRKQKLSEFLARRGFNWDSIKEVIKRIDSSKHIE